ncbi:MAG: hypothetical protein QW838_07900 [Candidatus Nitrosotenuis sp.]
MNKLVIVFVAVIVAAVITALYFSEPFATARPQSKVHFTKTISSTPDPGIGQTGNQFVLLLSPNQGSIYDGSVTFTATIPVEFVVLHELDKSDDKGQPTWSVDGNTIYAMSVIEPPSSANSLEFTGAAVAFRSKTPFTITASVDGWIRGQPTEVVIQQLKPVEKSLYLPDSHLSVTIPMRSGLFAKEPVYYIITDSSNQTLAEKASRDWKVQFAPKLRWAPASAQDLLYVFTNGEKGGGIYGYQADVFASTPLQKDSYSPLRNLVLVSWKSGQKPQLLDSVDAILKAEKESRIKLSPTNVTINAPQIVWPGGQMVVTNQTISDEFGKSQLTNIDKDSRKATFVAHRVWGADGRTIYHIITDATPVGPAEILGVPVAPKLVNTLSANVFSDMYQFKNGIKGAGPLGFQQSVMSSKLDNDYIPVCRISVVEWKDQGEAVILETVEDINKKQSDGKIRVQLARPLSEDHLVNCPVIELPKSNKR